MSAQRRSVVKRNATAGADPGVKRRPAPAQPRPDQPTAAAPQRPAKPAPQRPKAQSETKQHPLAQRTDSVKRLWRDTRAELIKVTWPDKETTRNLTMVVIGISFVLGIFLGGIDYILFQILEALS